MKPGKTCCHADNLGYRPLHDYNDWFKARNLARKFFPYCKCPTIHHLKYLMGPFQFLSKLCPCNDSMGDLGPVCSPKSPCFFLTPKPKYILRKMWLLSDSVRLLILGLPKPKIMETYGKAYNPRFQRCSISVRSICFFKLSQSQLAGGLK
jgi:hypothetical protein